MCIRGGSFDNKVMVFRKKSSEEKITTGKKGEDLAVEFLRDRHCHILKRNYRKRFGEIDIVVQDGQDLVFVEVKTRRSQIFGAPLEAVTPKKQHQISKTALAYLTEYDCHDASVRFDVIAVHLTESSPRVELIQNAFEFCG